MIIKITYEESYYITEFKGLKYLKCCCESIIGNKFVHFQDSKQSLKIDKVDYIVIDKKYYLKINYIEFDSTSLIIGIKLPNNSFIKIGNESIRDISLLEITMQ